MNKFLKSGLTLAVAMAGSLTLTSPAYANLLLDGFGDPQPIGSSLVDDTDDGVAETSGPVQIFDTDFTNVWRTLTAELTGTGGGSSEVTAQTIDGVYEHTQSAGEDGYTRIDWEFDSSTVNDPVNILTDVSFIDTSADLSFALTDGDDNSASKTEAVTSDGVAVHQFGSFDGIDMTDITAASLEISGATSLDMNLDFVEVPAPGILGLMGLGLAGVGFFARGRSGRA